MSKNAATMDLIKKHRKDFVEKHADEYQANADFDAEQKAKAKQLAETMRKDPEFVGDTGTHIVGSPDGAFGITGIGGALHGMGGLRGGPRGGFGPGGPGPHGPGVH